MSLISGVQLPVDRIADLCRRYGVQELAIFGSAVVLDSSNLRLLADLESLLGRRVDLVTKRGLKPRVRPHVLREARLVYAA